MRPAFLPLAFALLLAGPALAGARHVITIGTGLRPAGLAWDPTAQHFLVGSRLRPAVSAVSDADVVETLVSAGDALFLAHNSSVAALAVDDPRRRLLAAFTNPPAVAAFDLRSARPHRRLFATALPAAPAGLALDPASGRAFVTAGNQILKLDLDGNPTSLSRSAIYESDEGWGGAAYVSRGFLLVAQGITGKLFKVDEETGAARHVLLAGGDHPSAAAVALMANGAVVVAGDRSVRRLRSRDGWAEAVVEDESSPPVAAEAGGVIRGVAMRDGKKAYVLVSMEEEGEEDGGTLGKKSRIEEVEWGKEGEGEMVLAMVLVGFGLAYFFYWRFQMRELVSNMNKKRA